MGPLIQPLYHYMGHQVTMVNTYHYIGELLSIIVTNDGVVKRGDKEGSNLSNL